VSYYDTGITFCSDVVTSAGRIVTVRTTHIDKVLQLYAGGELIEEREPVNGTATFTLLAVPDAAVLLVIAVDADSRGTNYWEEYFTGDDYADKFEVSMMALNLTYSPGDVMIIYRGDAGDESAATEIHRRDVFADSSGIGYGLSYGDSYGYDDGQAPGYGTCYGYEYGIDAEQITFQSESLPRGTYPVKVVIEDSLGNESTAYETTIEVESYARPASSLAITSYTSGTDTVVLSFTPSEDIS